MKDLPLISVVMSAYNAEKYLDESIQSILSQTYQNFEFIIINDGSTDRSLEIIENYAKKDNRIVVISRENRGLIASLNEGMKKAKGKYIARMDADDISMPARLAKQVEFMENNIEYGVCGTGVVGFGEYIKEKVWILSSIDSVLKTELLFSSCFAHPTVVMRKDLIYKHNLFYDKEFMHAEDFELWCRFAHVSKFTNIKEPLVKYRILENSITREADKNIKKRYQTIKVIFEKYLKELDMQNSEKENYLHFNLTVNTRMKENPIEFVDLKNYFSKIINANNKKQLFDEAALKKVLGKKWLWNAIYRKNIKAIFSKYFIYGLRSIFTK